MGHVARTGAMINAFTILIQSCEVKKQFVRSRGK
jgi:hypothetical protein